MTGNISDVRIASEFLLVRRMLLAVMVDQSAIRDGAGAVSSDMGGFLRVVRLSGPTGEREEDVVERGGARAEMGDGRAARVDFVQQRANVRGAAVGGGDQPQRVRLGGDHKAGEFPD